jgi:hypothetical protein
MDLFNALSKDVLILRLVFCENNPPKDGIINEVIIDISY